MGGQSLDQILRSLEPRGEVSFELGDIPVDELLLTLHETRFTGVIELGREAQCDRVIMKDGKVLDAAPTRFQHVQLLAEVLREMDLLTGDTLRKIIEDDPMMDGDTFGRRMVSRGLLTREQLRDCVHEQARRRLFFLYDHSGGPVRVRHGIPAMTPTDALPVDILPAVAYGVVVRAHPRRRQAMMVFAANKRARLIATYDVERNRCGLPEPLLSAAGALSDTPVQFDTIPCLPGLTPDTTSGLLLLFQRMQNLELVEASALPREAPRIEAQETGVLRRASR